MRLSTIAFSLATSLGALSSLSVFAAVPDSDGDGVSDYDDHCPKTPFGLRVWTKLEVETRNLPARWVGCGGPKDPYDTEYNPPADPTLPPAEPAVVDKLFQLYKTGSVPQPSDISGVFIGRCFNPEKDRNLPISYAHVLHGGVTLSPEGPIGGNITAFGILWYPDFTWDELDHVSTKSELIRTTHYPLYSLNRYGTGGVVRDNALYMKADDEKYARMNNGYIIVKRYLDKKVDKICYFFKKLKD